eukprot:scaffold233012_cov26-Tisochrysis_lutea.AAC.1
MVLTVKSLSGLTDGGVCLTIGPYHVDYCETLQYNASGTSTPPGRTGTYENLSAQFGDARMTAGHQFNEWHQAYTLPRITHCQERTALGVCYARQRQSPSNLHCGLWLGTFDTANEAAHLSHHFQMQLRRTMMPHARSEVGLSALLHEDTSLWQSEAEWSGRSLWQANKYQADPAAQLNKAIVIVASKSQRSSK